MHKSKLIAAAVLAGMCLKGSTAAIAANLTTIVSSVAGDASPNALVVDTSGNIFVTTGDTGFGDNSNSGSAFELTASNHSMVNFGAFPVPPYSGGGDSPCFPTSGGPMVITPSGTLYGTTKCDSGYEGSYGGGAVFQISSGSHQISELTSLSASIPLSTSSLDPYGLLADTAGNLYGATYSGGSGGAGSVFKVVAATGVCSVLYNFSGDASYSPAGCPSTPVTLQSGFLYGGIYGSGVGSTNGLGGSIYKLNVATNSLTTVATLSNNTNASDLALDSSGNIYGVSKDGGTYGDGSVFEILAGTNTVLTLASFNNSNGNDPTTLVLDPSGNLYGITASGGSAGDGTVFEVPAGTSSLFTLATFNGTNGQMPTDLAYSSGALYGTTSEGGSSSDGTVFEVTGLSVPEPSGLVLIALAMPLLARYRRGRSTR